MTLFHAQDFIPHHVDDAFTFAIHRQPLPRGWLRMQSATSGESLGGVSASMLSSAAPVPVSVDAPGDDASTIGVIEKGPQDFGQVRRSRSESGRTSKKWGEKKKAENRIKTPIGTESQISGNEVIRVEVMSGSVPQSEQGGSFR
jgi:hypothetical protein